MNLLKLLADNRRLRVLPDIAELFDKLKTDVENSINVVLTAASPVDDTQQNKLAVALKARFGGLVDRMLCTFSFAGEEDRAAYMEELRAA